MTKPTIVAFPGTWHPGSCMEPFISQLQTLGFAAEAHTLSNFNDASKGLEDDEKGIRSAVNHHIDQGKDVILILHSWAGIPGSAAITGIAKKTNQSVGRIGGLIGVIYISAYIPKDTLSNGGTFKGKMEPWIQIEPETGLCYAMSEFHRQIFFNDVEPNTAELVSKTLGGCALKAAGGFPSSVGYKDAEFDGRRAYIQLSKDRALVPEDQQRAIDESGVNFLTRVLDSSHSPFISMPAELAKTVEDIVNEFGAPK